MRPHEVDRDVDRVAARGLREIADRITERGGNAGGRIDAVGQRAGQIPGHRFNCALLEKLWGAADRDRRRTTIVIGVASALSPYFSDKEPHTERDNRDS